MCINITGWFRGASPRKYMLPVAIGSLTMAVGFGIRAYWKYQPDSVGIYAVQTLVSMRRPYDCSCEDADSTGKQFLLLSPCAYLAQCYILLPRLAHHLDSTDLLFISAQRIGKIFIWTDVVTFLLQAAGGGMSAGGSVAMSDAGHWVSADVPVDLMSLRLTLCLPSDHHRRSGHTMCLLWNLYHPFPDLLVPHVRGLPLFVTRSTLKFL